MIQTNAFNHSELENKLAGLFFPDRLHPDDLLVLLHVEGTWLPRRLFQTMLTAPTSNTAAEFAIGRMLDSLPAPLSNPDGTPGPVNAPAAWRLLISLPSPKEL